uniref:Uncharacterized protein n=1 Tax=Meloidogyne enterolobii TaxID=390850 RepID=A0A6V7VCE1_MELEN|nr:unnamed protein product [Meloidogyne enterolobii]
MKSIYLIIFTLLFLVGNIVCPRGDPVRPSGPSNDPPCYPDPTDNECKNFCRNNMNDSKCKDFCVNNRSDKVCINLCKKNPSKCQ